MNICIYICIYIYIYIYVYNGRKQQQYFIKMLPQELFNIMHQCANTILTICFY